MQWSSGGAPLTVGFKDVLAHVCGGGQSGVRRGKNEAGTRTEREVLRAGRGQIFGNNSVANILSPFLALIYLTRSTWSCTSLISRPIKEVEAYTEEMKVPLPQGGLWDLSEDIAHALLARPHRECVCGKLGLV